MRMSVLYAINIKQYIVIILFCFKIIDPLEGFEYKSIQKSILDFEWRIYDEYTLSMADGALACYNLSNETQIIKYNSNSDVNTFAELILFLFYNRRTLPQ